MVHEINNYCELCDIYFENERKSYEHNISFDHHRRYDKIERFHGRTPNGPIIGLKNWSIHISGKAHKTRCFHFNKHGMRDRLSVNNPNFPFRNQKTSKNEISYNTPNRRMNYKRPHSQKHSKLENNEDSTLAVYNIDNEDEVSKRHKSDCANKNEGGMMLNILQSIHTNVNVDEISDTISSRNSTIPSIPQSRSERAPDCSNNNVSQRTTNTSTKHLQVSSLPTVVDTSDAIMNEVEFVDKPSVGDDEVQCVEQALSISQELRALKIKQNELEMKLKEIETELLEIKNKRRNLKQHRSYIIRGLARSDSDDESYSNCSNMQPVAISSALTTPNRSHKKQVASIAPMDVPIISSLLSLPASNSLSFHQCDSQLLDDYPRLSVTNCENCSDHQVQRIALHDTQQFNEKRGCIRDIVSSTKPASFNATPSCTSFLKSMNPFPTSSNSIHPLYNSDAISQEIDMERLSLIRQALNSPDSWRFTFEQVDQMLQQTAERAAKAATITDKTHEVDSTSRPPCGRPTGIGTTDESATMNKSIKTDPDGPTCTANLENANVSSSSSSHTNSNVVDLLLGDHVHPSRFDPKSTQNSLSLSSIENPIIKPQDSSSSFTSSDGDIQRQVVVADSNRKTKKRGALSNSTPRKASSTQPRSVSVSAAAEDDAMRPTFKFGEFHAFNGSTTAVIDLIVCRAKQTLFVGGQNGYITEHDLKTHQLLNNLSSGDSSVTKMLMDWDEKHLYVGYYDNHLVEYDLKTYSSSSNKKISGRIEALALSPVSTLPFIYIGLNNGQLLRYDLRKKTIGVLCVHTSDSIRQETFDSDVNAVSTDVHSSSTDEVVGISSMTVVQSGTSLLIIIGGQDRSLSVRSANDGTLIWGIRTLMQKGPPLGIKSLMSECMFMSYSDRSIRIHNWKTGFAIHTFQTQRITSSCVMDRYMAVGDSDGAIRVFKFQLSGLPSTRPMKVYFASARAAITSLVSSGDTLIAGSLDGTVTIIWVNEPVSNYTCLYGPFGKNCGMGFSSKCDLIKHVLNTHLIFGSQKTVMCRWGAGRCKARFTDTQTMKSISDHLLCHIPD